MKLVVSSGGLTPGSYYADFVGVKEVNNEYGPGLQWEWRAVPSGQTITRITQAKPTPKNACGRILAGLTGSALSIGGEVDLDSLVGKRYIVIVQATENGSSRVESVSPMPMPPPAPQQGPAANPTTTQPTATTPQPTMTQPPLRVSQ